MGTFTRAATLAAAVASAAALAGCFTIAAAGAGAGALAYAKGELRATVAAPIDDAYRATRAALEELQLPVADSAKDAFGARLTATQAQGGDVNIVLERKADRVTSIGIRVGTFGDEAKAREILRAIQDNL